MKFIFVETKTSLLYLYILARLRKKIMLYKRFQLTSHLTLASRCYFRWTISPPSERTYFMDHPLLESAKAFLESSLANQIVDAFLCF